MATQFPLYQAQANYFNSMGRANVAPTYSADDLAIGPINRNPFTPPSGYRTPPINPGY